MNLKKKFFIFIIKNRLFLFFLFITILGIIPRIILLFSYDIFTDEVFYTETARLTSFGNLLTHSFWIKDHGILYLLFLKIAQVFTTDIVYLRLSNLIIFIIINFTLFCFFKKIKTDITSLIPVALFSFLPYFMFINIYVTPYNFVILFSLLSFMFLTRFIFFEDKYRMLELFLFSVFLALAFYSDFSSVYMYISLVGVLIFVYFFKREKLLFLITALLFNINLILPEVAQTLNSLSRVEGLSALCCSANARFSVFLPSFLYAIFFRVKFIISFSILVVSGISLLAIFKKNKNPLFRYYSLYIGVGFIIAFTFFYVVNNNFLPIFVERTFFFFNFLIILFCYCMFLFLGKKGKFLLLLVLILLIIWRFFQISVIEGGVLDRNIRYREFISEIINRGKIENSEEVIFFDKEFNYVPLQRYYFLGLDEHDRYKINDIKRESLFISKYYGNVKGYLKEPKDQLYVFFTDEDSPEFKDIKQNIIDYKKNNSSGSVKIFYFLTCSTDIDCRFNEFNINEK